MKLCCICRSDSEEAHGGEKGGKVAVKEVSEAWISMRENEISRAEDSLKIREENLCAAKQIQKQEMELRKKELLKSQIEMEYRMKIIEVEETKLNVRQNQLKRSVKNTTRNIRPRLVERHVQVSSSLTVPIRRNGYWDRQTRLTSIGDSDSEDEEA